MTSFLNYRSIPDLNNVILTNLHKFPNNISLIVGIPRSGMLPANLLALYLNKPYTDMDSFINGRIYSSGERLAFIDNKEIKRILVVDDSICTGRALNKAKQKISFCENKEQYEFIFSAIFATTQSQELVNFFCEIIDGPRVFQWNLFHHPQIIQEAFFDIDGVLCPNPPIDDDGELYMKFIKNTPCLYKPSLKIDTIISCRLEKYRKQTEEWLKNNGIIYNKLILLDMPNKSARQKWGKHGQFKGEHYKKSCAKLFVESSLKEARVIHSISKKPVFCTETFEMINKNHPTIKIEGYFELVKIWIWTALKKLRILT